VTSAEEFAEFAEGMSPRLRRTAFLLCGDWHTAEDLAQTTLEKMFVSWRRIRRQDAVHGYATRTLVNTYLAHKRLKHTGELLTEWFPEPVVRGPEVEVRMVVLDALASLAPRGRAVVVLRFWEDLSVEQVADVLGCSAGNVKSLSARALGKLRAVLGEALAEPGSPGYLPGENCQARKSCQAWKICQARKICNG
jgi:RNA polymerase sigma-70 factor (sigma-E family)